MIDARVLTKDGRHGSTKPVTSAIYTMQVLMNEEEPVLTDKAAKDAFAAEMQRALDAGFFTDIRYDYFQFEVVSRVVIYTDPANEETR